MKCVVIEKISSFLSRDDVTELQRAMLNESTLDVRWISEKGWTACHFDDSNLTRFTATALIRYCRRMGLNHIFSVGALDLFRSRQGDFALRKVPVTLDGISQACFGIPQEFELTHPDYDWFLKASFGSNLFFSVSSEAKMIFLRDASSCTTIAGDNKFIGCMLEHARRTWYPGVPHDGIISCSQN